MFTLFQGYISRVCICVRWDGRTEYGPTLKGGSAGVNKLIEEEA